MQMYPFMAAVTVTVQEGWRQKTSPPLLPLGFCLLLFPSGEACAPWQMAAIQYQWTEHQDAGEMLLGTSMAKDAVKEKVKKSEG